MQSRINALEARRILGRDQWRPPIEFGTGWRFQRFQDGEMNAEILASYSPLPTGAEVEDHHRVEWLHTSMVVIDRGAPEETMPSYADLCLMHRAFFGDRWAYQVFAPRAEHVNIHSGALHLWGRLDGKAVLPNFGGIFGGSI